MNQINGTATVYDAHGNTITAGLPTCERSSEAVVVAQRIARTRAEVVYLLDSDGYWAVDPDGTLAETELPGEVE